MTITTSWILANFSCPSWRSITDESALRSALAGLDESSASLHWWLGFWTFWVAVGVALEVVFVIWEYFDELHDFRQGIIHAPDRPQTALFVLGLLGAGLVAAGVSGELWKEAQIGKLETCIRKGNDALFLLLSKEAGDAAGSAASAQMKLGAVTKETADIESRLGSASQKLESVERDMFAVGPRWRLLENGKDDFVKALIPFPNQRVTVVICGNEDGEREGLTQLLFNLFPKAGWKPDGHRWINCPNLVSGGNELYFVSASDDSPEWKDLPEQQWAKVQCGRFNLSHDALNTLCDALYKLRIYTIAWREKPLPEDDGILKARLFFAMGTPDGPAELAYKDPGRIFLLIGPNAPMFSHATKHPSKHAKTK